ncbi:MAG: hypothetical protein MAG794_01112 [Gammaproteobacteria bacterium]|nr:hypothetical protein [Gammaproteobacteria bacterium]
MKITLNRFMLFVTAVLLVGLTLQQCWQRKPEAEKWLYLFEEPARVYAGRVLGPDRGTGLLPPEALSDMEVHVYARKGYVEFASTMFSPAGEPSLRMAFAPDSSPPDPVDQPGFAWTSVHDGWYQLRPAP